MKKLNYLLMGLFVASAFTFTSCTSEDDEPASAEIYYSVDDVKDVLAGSVIEAALGKSIDLTADFTMGTNKIESIKVTLDYEGANYVLIDSTLNTGLFNGGDKTFTFDYSTNVASKDKKLTFTATDTKGLVADFVVTIKPTAASIKTGVVVTSEAKLLGGQANTNGSLYSVFLDQVIKLVDGAGVSSSIDLVYYYGSTNFATLAAPSATATQSVYSKIATWSTKNATKFAKLSGVSFSEITTEAAFETAYGTAPTATEATALTPGDVLSIVTAKGQKAIVKVKAISATTTAGAITIEVKTVTK